MNAPNLSGDALTTILAVGALLLSLYNTYALQKQRKDRGRAVGIAEWQASAHDWRAALEAALRDDLQAFTGRHADSLSEARTTLQNLQRRNADKKLASIVLFLGEALFLAGAQHDRLRRAVESGRPALEQMQARDELRETVTRSRLSVDRLLSRLGELERRSA